VLQHLVPVFCVQTPGKCPFMPVCLRVLLYVDIKLAELFWLTFAQWQQLMSQLVALLSRGQGVEGIRSMHVDMQAIFLEIKDLVKPVSSLVLHESVNGASPSFTAQYPCGLRGSCGGEEAANEVQKRSIGRQAWSPCSCGFAVVTRSLAKREHCSDQSQAHSVESRPV
jgi:hypothetical protein